MKLLLSPLTLALALLSGGKLPGAAATSIRGGVEEVTELTYGNMTEDQSLNARLLSERRRLLPKEGVLTALIIRTTDSAGNEPPTSAAYESDVWFGTHDLEYTYNQNSMASLYDQCSGGKLNFIPAVGNNVIDGVFEFTVDRDLNGMSMNDAGNYIIREFFKVNVGLGLVFDSYSVVCPNGVQGSGGIAGGGGSHQFYAGGAEKNLEVVFHELGHNIGHIHSGVIGGGQYDDNSCMMGCCAGAQQMCFNAPKSWYSGWYSEAGKEGHLDLTNLRTPGQWWKGKLVGLDDYLNGYFDDTEHRVIARTPGFFMMFNRAKGVNGGVKAYRDQVTIVQQWSGRHTSWVLGTLDESNSTFTYSSEYFDFDIIIHVCQIVYAPDFTGPQIIGGTASQSSTSYGREAFYAIDNNLLNTWNGVTRTNAEIDPWWKWVLDTEEEVEHIRVHNRDDCCGSRLNNAFIELFDGDGNLVFSKNMKNAEYVKEVFLEGVYNVKEVVIRLQGSNKVLSLAEVELFGPVEDPQPRQPDYAEVFAYVADRSNPVPMSCDHTTAPTLSALPSSYPTMSFEPTYYVNIPSNVILTRDNSPCILQQNPSNHPDRYKCMIQRTASSNEPGGYGNDDVDLLGVDGCVVVVQPVTWAYGGTAFIFESDEDLDTINACFATGTRITELGPTFSPSMAPNSDFTPNPTKIPTESPTKSPTDAPTSMPTKAPTKSPTKSPTKAPTAAPTNAPTNVPTKSPTKSPTDAPTDIPTINPTKSPTAAPTETPTKVLTEPPVGSSCESDLDCDDLDACTTNVCNASGTCTYEKDACDGTGEVCVEKQCMPPVVLLRDGSPCVFQHNPSNHPDRFKCMLQPTIVSSEPGTYGNDEVSLISSEGCVLSIRPVTWAWAGNAFIFESDDDLNMINACFAPNTLLSKSQATPSPTTAPTDPVIPTGVLLLRDETSCIFQHNPSNHPDRFKCMLQPTIVSSEPNSYGNDEVVLQGEGGCVLSIRPVTWAWAGNAFIFESDDDLNTINACFTPGTLITDQ